MGKEHDFLLVQRALCNDQAAYNKIFNRYHSYVYMNIACYVSNRETCEDIMMETFEKAFSILHRFKPDYTLNVWLSKIARNKAIDSVRKSSRNFMVRIDENSDDEDVKPLQLKEPEANPEEAMLLSQDRKTLRGFINKLPNRYKDIMEMRYLYGFTVSEISDETEYTIGEIHECLHKGEKMLTKLYNKYGK